MASNDAEDPRGIADHHSALRAFGVVGECFWAICLQSSGYSHTYFTKDDVDFALLAQYPTDLELSVAYEIATEENNCLWSLLGIHPNDIVNAPDPGITLTAQPAPDPDFETLYLNEDLDVVETAEPTAAEQLQQVVDSLKSAVNISRAGDEELDACVMASVALVMEELGRIEDLPASNPERFVEIQKEIAHAMATQPTAFVALLNLAPLVALQREHQTREERIGVRTYKGSGTHKNPKTGVEKPLTERQILAQKMQAIVQRDQERGSSTGLNRIARWTNGTGSAPLPTTGNEANAELVAGGRVKDAMKRRRTIFGKVKCISRVVEAGIGSTCELAACLYGFAMLGSEIFLARIITMYSKKGGKAGAHSWVPTCDTIGSLSSLATAIMRPSELYGSDAEAVNEFRDHVEIGLGARRVFKELRAEKEMLGKAVASLNTIRRKGKANKRKRSPVPISLHLPRITLIHPARIPLPKLVPTLPLPLEHHAAPPIAPSYTLDGPARAPRGAGLQGTPGPARRLGFGYGVAVVVEVGAEGRGVKDADVDVEVYGMDVGVKEGRQPLKCADSGCPYSFPPISAAVVVMSGTAGGADIPIAGANIDEVAMEEEHAVRPSAGVHERCCIRVIPIPPNDNLLTLLEHPSHKDTKHPLLTHRPLPPTPCTSNARSSSGPMRWTKRFGAPACAYPFVGARRYSLVGVMCWVAHEEGARRGGRDGVERVGQREDSVRCRRGGGGKGRGRWRAWMEERGVPKRRRLAIAQRGGVWDDVAVDEHVLRALVIGERRARLNGAGVSSGDGGATSTFPIGWGYVWKKSYQHFHSSGTLSLEIAKHAAWHHRPHMWHPKPKQGGKSSSVRA
ncbi:hypothetical protein B0H13DRAFT_2411179 [Mycena leptocephala]|nr:hypothetical protein B0H13DRAFT_2411179 [Mycena leptocephala]